MRHLWLAFAFLPLLANAQTVTPGDNLVLEGIPAIPASVAESVARYTEFRSAAFDSWHPSRREMLITTRFADAAQIHRVNFPGGARTQLTFFRDPVSGAQYRPVGGNDLLFSKDAGGNELYQLYLYTASTGDYRMLTDGKSRNTGAQWSYQGDRVLYTSNRRNADDFDFYVMNPDQPGSDRLLAQRKGGGWGTLDWSPDGKQAVVENSISANESHLYLLDTTVGTIQPLTPEEEHAAYGGARFAKDGQGIYLTSDQGSENQRLGYLDLQSRRITFLTSDIPFDVEQFDLSSDGKMASFITNESGLGVLNLLDLRTRKHSRVAGIPVGVVLRSKWHQNSRDLAFELSTGRSAQDVYSVDVRTGKVERWTASEGATNTEQFAMPELIKWKAPDGMQISGFLYPPPTRFTGPRPVIVNVHGGPEGQSRPGFIGRSNYFVNELGCAIIYPNVRGSTGFGKSFLAADNGFSREASYEDMNALFDWIKKQPDLDGNHIMVTGGSYGGHMTLAAASRYSDKIACALDVVGMSNLVTFLEHTSGYRRDLRRVEYGDERDPKMREFLLRIAPMTNVANIKKPLFVVAGYNDPRVPYTEAEQIVESVKKVGTPVWFLMAKDEGHGFAKKKNADFQFYATVQFVKQYLLGTASS
jgi:dipeptidyl aminopeptidase/acylaminoacyl peptidase